MSQILPYRTAAVPESRPRPPAEYVYIARERDLNAAFHRIWIRTLLFGTAGAGCVASQGAPSVAGFVFLAVLAWAVVSWRRTRGGAAIVLRVEQGELTVETRGGGRTLLPALPLRSLCDVALDTRSIAPVMRDTSIGAVGIETKVRGEVDIARILMVPLPPRPPVALTEEHLAHMDAVEGIGKIRTFLRAHGWIPEDERDGQA